MLDLEADSERQRDAFVKALTVILHSYDNCFRLHPCPSKVAKVEERKGNSIKFQLLARTKNLPRPSMAPVATVLGVFEYNPASHVSRYIAHTEKNSAETAINFGVPLVVPMFEGQRQHLKFVLFAVDEKAEVCTCFYSCGLEKETKKRKTIRTSCLFSELEC